MLSIIPLVLGLGLVEAGIGGTGACPSCSNWQGGAYELCAIDGQTYQTKCDLFVALCNIGLIDAGSDVDINTINLEDQVDDFIASPGPCQDVNPAGTCPECTEVSGPRPVCATMDGEAEQFNSYCELARKLCKQGIIGFSENSDFTMYTEEDFADSVISYLDWEGLCDGPCPAGQYSRSGRYPCQQCEAGSYSDTTAQTSCLPCPKGTYQELTGQGSCVRCPPGQSTPTTGATSVAECESVTPCQPGTISVTGYEPCSPCPRDSYSEGSGSTRCTPCPDGKQTEGDGARSENECKQENLTPRGNATQSGVTWGGVPEKAVDGDLTQSCHSIHCSHTAFQLHPWWQVDLGKDYPIGSVVVTIPLDTMTGVEGAVVSVDGSPIGTLSLSAMTLGTALLHSNRTGRVVRVESRLTVPTYLSLVEVRVYGGMAEVPCPRGTVSDSGFLPCNTCKRGYTTFREGGTECVRCPRGGTTTLDNPGKCIGRMLRVCKHDEFHPPCDDIQWDVPSVDSHRVSWLRQISAVESIRGNWVVYSRSNYRGQSMLLAEGEREADLRRRQVPENWWGESWNDKIRSIRHTATDYDCYTGDGSSYTGRESKTLDGKSCQRWNYNWPNKPTLAERSLPSNYCRNPAGSGLAGPWCYVTERGGATKELCDIPRC